MVYRFLEKDERPKPTIAMDYSFGRKTVKSLVSDTLANIFILFENIFLNDKNFNFFALKNHKYR